ncbi:MAG: hypothetical protein RRY29_06590 [Desulfovibrionaceae bacterium]
MTNIQRPSGGQRAVLAFVGLGLVVMLAISFMDRMRNPDMVVVNGGDAGMGAAQSGGEGMNPDIAKLMEHLGKNPNDVAALMHLSEHLVNEHNWAAAETFIRRAVAADPTNSQPVFLLGVVQHNLGQHKEAAVSLEKVLGMKDEASVRYSLGVLYIYFLNDTTNGIKHLSAGLNDPKAPEELKKKIREELEKAPLPAQKKK